MICLIRIYKTVRIQRSGAGVGSNGVRQEVFIRQQSTRDFLFKCNQFLLEKKEEILKSIY